MAKITRKKKGSKEKGSGASSKKFDASLPEEAYEPNHGMADFIWMFHGEPKIGKSTLIGQFPNVFCMFFEPGGKSIKVRQKYIPDWDAAMKVLDQLEANPDYCDIVSIDTGYMAYERCFQHTLKEFGYERASDGDWGEVWTKCREKFEAFHNRIFSLGKGFIVTAHSELKTIKKKNGLEHTKIKTQLGAQAWKFYNGIVDVIGYYEYSDDGGRIMTIRGSSDVEAGCRMTEQFKYKDGSPITEIDMGDSEFEAFSNLEKGFNNELTRKGEKTVGSKKSKKKKSVIKKRRS